MIRMLTFEFHGPFQGPFKAEYTLMSFTV